MNEKIQYKFVSEVTATKAESDGKLRFSGYLAYFGNVDSYGDVIEKGAFVKTLREAKRAGRTIPVLEQHGGGVFGGSDMTPIGFYDELKEDDRGLWAEGVLFSNSRGKDMYVALKEAPKGAMGQSIGYSIVKSRIPEASETRKTGVYQYLEEVKLWEGSIVTFPANEKARVDDVKAASMFWRQMESHFKKNGFSGEDAKKAISLIKSCTPDAAFAKFIAQYGNIEAEEKADETDAKNDRAANIEAATKLLSILTDAKKAADMNAFKSMLKEFTLK